MTDKKKFEDLTPEDTKNLEIVFAPGCFDSFDGSQEELDEFIAEVTRLIRSGEILEKSVPVEDLDEDEIEFIDNLINQTDNRTIQ